MKRPTIRVVIISLVGVLLGILVVILSIEFSRGMKKLLTRHEEDHIRQHAQTASVLMQSAAKRVADVTRDWSRWDAMNKFASDHNKNFLHNELNEDVFSLYRLNVVLVFNKNFELVYKRFYDFESGKDFEPGGDLNAALNNFKSMLDKKRGTGSPGDLTLNTSPGLSGYIRHYDTWVCLSSFPILNSTGTSEPNGILVFGRIFDDQEMESIGAGMGLNMINRVPYSTIELLEEQNFFKDDAFKISYGSPDHIEIFALIDTISDEKIVISLVDNRTVYKEGSAITKSITASAIVSSLIIVTILFFLLEKLILTPLNRLAQYVDHINELKAPFDPPNHWGYELTVLIKALRTMFGKLAERQQIIMAQSSEMRYRLSHDSLTGLSNIAHCEHIFKKTITSSQPSKQMVIHFFYINPVNLKLVNSTMGFAGGDAVMKEMSRRLRENFSDALSVACIDGPHFALLL